MSLIGYNGPVRYENRIDDGELTDILKNAKLNRRGQYIGDCPFCGKEEHFYISRDTQMWDCKKCKESGNIYKLLRHFDRLYLLKGATVKATETISSIRQRAAEQGQNEAIKSLPRIKLPVGYKKGVQGMYLFDRGITPEEVERYGFGYTTLVSRYKNYVILPVYDDGEVRGYLGRYAAKKPPGKLPRWSNSPGTNFAALLFGYDEITDETETVILVEGAFDKIKVDRVLRTFESPYIKCCATFGKEIHDDQIQKLVSKGIANVVLLYDFDAIREIKRFGLALEKFFITTITFTRRKDIDECTDDEALEVLGNLRKPRDFNMNVIGSIK